MWRYKITVAIDVKDFDQDNDVIEITPNRGSTDFLEGKYICLPKNLLGVVYQCLNKGGVASLSTGLVCRLMRVDQPKWQKGKLKLTLEFIPDEPPQDELSSIRSLNID